MLSRRTELMQHTVVRAALAATAGDANQLTVALLDSKMPPPATATEWATLFAGSLLSEEVWHRKATDQVLHMRRAGNESWLSFRTRYVTALNLSELLENTSTAAEQARAREALLDVVEQDFDVMEKAPFFNKSILEILAVAPLLFRSTASRGNGVAAVATEDATASTADATETEVDALSRRTFRTPRGRGGHSFRGKPRQPFGGGNRSASSKADTIRVDRCARCEGKEHTAATCPSEEGSEDKRLCYSCLGRGHIARDHLNEAKSGKGQPR